MSKRILLVDDSLTVLTFERMMLAGEGFELETASSGSEALQKVEAKPSDLVLLDIMLPGIDGVETCRQLKENPTTRHIPVIMVTTKGESANVERAFAAGCDDYLTKPLDKLELITKVRWHLGSEREGNTG